MDWLFIILLFGFILFIMSRRFPETKKEMRPKKTPHKSRFQGEMNSDSITDDARILAKDHALDIEEAEQVLNIIDEYGVDEDTALELIDRL